MARASAAISRAEPGYPCRITPDRGGQFGQAASTSRWYDRASVAGSRESGLLVDSGLLDARLLDDGLTAVDRDCRGVDVPGVVGGEERGELGDIVCLTDPPEWVGCCQRAAGGIW